MVKKKQIRGAEMPGTHLERGRRNLSKAGVVASSNTAKQDVSCHETESLMETVVEEITLLDQILVFQGKS